MKYFLSDKQYSQSWGKQNTKYNTAVWIRKHSYVVTEMIARFA
jgi:hypothetical protein